MSRQPAIRVIAVLKELWLDILAVQRPRPIPNHNGNRHGHLGVVWRGWVSLYGTRPDTRRVEGSPLTGRNRPFGAAAHHQHQKHKSRPPPVAKAIRRDETLNKESTEQTYHEAHRVFHRGQCGHLRDSLVAWQVSA